MSAYTLTQTQGSAFSREHLNQHSARHSNVKGTWTVLLLLLGHASSTWAPLHGVGYGTAEFVATVLCAGWVHPNVCVLLANTACWDQEHPGQTHPWGKARDDKALLLHFLSVMFVTTYASLLSHTNLVPLIPAGLHLKHYLTVIMSSYSLSLG